MLRDRRLELLEEVFPKLKKLCGSDKISGAEFLDVALRVAFANMASPTVQGSNQAIAMATKLVVDGGRIQATVEAQRSFVEQQLAEIRREADAARTRAQLSAAKG